MLDPKDAMARVEQPFAEPEEADMPSATTIEVDVKDRRGRSYKGVFHYSVPTVGDLIKIGRMKAMYLPEGSPDMPATTLVDMISYLNVTCTFSEAHPRPAWFDKALELRDAAALQDLYGRCLAYETRFLSGDTVHGDDSRGSARAPTADGNGEAHVGRKVQAPAERRETLSGDGA